MMENFLLTMKGFSLDSLEIENEVFAKDPQTASVLFTAPLIGILIRSGKRMVYGDEKAEPWRIDALRKTSEQSITMLL